jgi:hypothetical protein
LVFRLNSALNSNWRTGGYGYYAVNFALRITAIFGVNEGVGNRIMEWIATGVNHTTSPMRFTEIRNVVTSTGLPPSITGCTISQELVLNGKLDIIFTCTVSGTSFTAGLISVERI